jgi:hypothetical protein
VGYEAGFFVADGGGEFEADCLGLLAGSDQGALLEFAELPVEEDIAAFVPLNFSFDDCLLAGELLPRLDARIRRDPPPAAAARCRDVLLDLVNLAVCTESDGEATAGTDRSAWQGRRTRHPRPLLTTGRRPPRRGQTGRQRGHAERCRPGRTG